MSENTIKVHINNKEKNLSQSDINISGQGFDHSNTPLVDDGIGLTIRDYGLHTKNGIVIFLDVLGMKGIWQRMPTIDIISNWNKVIRSFVDSLEKNASDLDYFFRVLSDTIIITLAHKLDYNIISRTFDLLLHPFIESMKRRMLLRGTISHGTFYLSERLIIGHSLDDAAYHHDKLDWIGVSVSPTLSKNIDYMNTIRSNSTTYYDAIPHKECSYGGLVLNWPADDSLKECYSILQQEIMNVEPLVRKKYNNTLDFYRHVSNSHYP